MKAEHIRKWMVGGALGAVTMFGGTVAASDYPPADTTVTTVVSTSQSGFRNPTATTSTSELAATGSSSDMTLKLAAGTVVAGVGLLAATKLRRRPAAAA